LEKRTFTTPLGEVWLWGEADAFEGTKPLIFAVLGAFNIETRWPDVIPEHLQGVSVVTAQLPGNHCPHLLTHSVGVYAAAYGQVLARLGRPAIVVGNSIGALVAMAMRAPNIRAILALEPPLHTAKLWPLVASFRRKLADHPDDARLAEFIWNVFGISAATVEDRDYSDLVARVSTPTIVLAGEEPLLPHRDLRILPSLLDDADRQVLRSHPRMQIWQVPGVGHNLVNGGASVVFGFLKRLLDQEFEGAEVKLTAVTDPPSEPDA
jgi:pimeloyl-ACP methyl ester carboxylesterase